MNSLDTDTIARIAATHGTPFYAYHWPTMEDRYHRLAAAVGHGTRILYSMKANPHPRITGMIAGLSWGVEAASGGELSLAMWSGVDPGRVFFTGPGKTDEELALAARAGLLAVSIESVGQARLLDRICGDLGVRRDVAIRVNPTESIAGARLHMGGLAGPFGVDQEDVPEVLRCCLGWKNLRCIGLHVYAGTGVLDAAALGAHVERTVAWAARVSSPHHLTMVNVGGGFGVPYRRDQKPLDLSVVAEAFARARQFLGSLPSGAELYVESGRYLVAEAGCYVARVLDIKESRGKRFVVLDGGINHLLAVGGLSRAVRANPSLRVVGREGAFGTDPVTVVGPLCTPSDRLADGMELPATLAVGDLVVADDVGAYGRSASPLNFLSRDWPAEYMVLGPSRFECISPSLSALDIWQIHKQ